jgi:Holliday junction resolvase RusA-like endonuclease
MATTSRVPGLELHLDIPRGERPFTRHEPLHMRGGKGSYPHPTTIRGMKAWRDEWQRAGSGKLPSPIALEVYVRMLRPLSHLRANGELAVAGKRYPYPTGFDLSNVCKLVEDALKGLAFDDDAHITTLFASKRWTTGHDKFGVGCFLHIRTASVGS